MNIDPIQAYPSNETQWPSVRWLASVVRGKAGREALMGWPLPLVVAVGYATVATVAAHFLSGLKAAPRTDLAAMSTVQLILNVIVLGPVIETILFQMTFCALAQRLKLGFWSAVFVAWIPFCGTHFLINLSTGIKAGVILGFFLSFLYVCKRKVSLGSAFGWTALFHILNNAISVAWASAF